MEPSDHLLRRKAGRMVATLTRIFGVHNVALAEDVVQDAFCSALEMWKFPGYGKSRMKNIGGCGAPKRATKKLPFTSGSANLQPGGCAKMDNQIEKRIELKAPVSCVWRALSDYREFGEWFRVKLDGPVVPGQISRGQITYPGYEHDKWEVVVQKMEPERLFSFTWKMDLEGDSTETATLVEFRLEKTTSGTLLLLTESGFGKIPSDRRLEAFRKNDGGWTEQMKNIEAYVAQRS